jgi:cystathionine beta-lyase/cystathionine gamma-synthase
MPKSAMKRLETIAIHAGEPEPRIAGAVAMPIFQSSTFLSGDEKGYHDVRYLRLNNTPNHAVLHAKLAALENGETALVTASGMAAISTSLLTVLHAGDHLLAQDCLYGGTHDFVTHDLKHFGISYTFIDANNPKSWETHLRPTTRAVYVESITNPLMQVCDLPAIARFAREHKLISMIDNTFASPVNFHPLDHGFTLCLHSGTKYLNGHNDIVCGAAIGPRELIEKIRERLNHLGGTLDPHACFLLNRGLKTLAVRVRHQSESAGRIARFLEAHDRVARVNYPGLGSHPHHRRARELFAGFGGMLSFELEGGSEAAKRLLEHLSLPLVAPSLGGVESLVTQPSRTSHVGLSAEDRKRLGITDGLIRLSVGLEATEDLIEDLDQALRA